MSKANLYAVVLLFIFVDGVFAQGDQLSPQLKSAITKIEKTIITNPGLVPLGSLATLNLQPGSCFVPPASTREFMIALGNTFSGEVLGMIIAGSQDKWDLDIMIVLESSPSGHILDADANKLDATAILDSIRSSTEAANVDRKLRNEGEPKVLGWDEPPYYDQPKRLLVWSINTLESDNKASINYNQNMLGRDTLLRMVAFGSVDNAKIKLFAKRAASNITYNPGMRYEDYQPGVDKLAEYGLAALIAGIAAKKLGFLALLLAFFVKGWKIILIVMVFFGGTIYKLLGFTKTTTPPEDEPASPQ
jgi:uncharacterized membrane-anchored protein